MASRSAEHQPASRADARLARLLALLPWLRAHPGVCVEDAARQFGITADQLRADVELLWFCGLPGLAGGDLIDVEFEGDTVRVLDAQALDRPLRLTSTEGVSLLAAARALQELPGLVDTDALQRVIAKLSAAVSAEAGQGEAPVAVQLGEHADRELLSTIRTALAEGRRLRLRYLVESRDEMTDREVDPLELHLTEGRAYLHAWDPGRQDTRSFRLDRIAAAEVLPEASAAPPSAPADRGHQLFDDRSAELTVVLELQPRARWVTDYYIVLDAEELVDGAQRVTLRTADSTWVARLMLSLGGAGRVLSPPELADTVKRLSADGLLAYRNPMTLGHADAFKA